MPVEYPYDTAFSPPAPVVHVRLGVPGAEPLVEVKALLDSGADISVLPGSLVLRLQLRRVDLAQVQGFGTEAREVPVFAATMALNEHLAWIARVVSWPEEYAILGRDAMNRWRTSLDGPSQATSIY